MRSAVGSICSLCGSSQRAPERSLGEWTVLACRCGLRTLHPQPATVEMEEFDEGSAYDHYFSLREPIMARHHRTLAGLEKVTRVPGRLLDVGCGTGFFLEAARTRGWTGVGVDPSPFAVARTKELGFEAHQGMLEDVDALQAGSFDAVALLQVVEHVPDPGPLLRACERLLKPGGALLIATPNPDGLLARVKKEDWNYWIPPMHCIWYPPRALSRCITDNGFRVARRKTWSARTAGLHDGADVLDATPLRRLRGRLRGGVADLLAKSMDATGYGTIVEQIGVRR